MACDGLREPPLVGSRMLAKFDTSPLFWRLGQAGADAGQEVRSCHIIELAGC